MADMIEYFDPGDTLNGIVNTGETTTGGKFVAQKATKQGTSVAAGNFGAGLDTTASGGGIPVGAPSAGGRVLGVATRDAVAGQFVRVVRKKNAIVPVVCGAANIAFNTEVQVDATGGVVAYSAGVKVGVTIADAIAGQTAMISLY